MTTAKKTSSVSGPKARTHFCLEKHRDANMAKSKRSQLAARNLSTELRLDIVALKPALRTPLTNLPKREAAYAATYANVPRVTRILRIHSGRIRCPAQDGGAIAANSTSPSTPSSARHQPPTRILAGQLRGAAIFTPAFYSLPDVTAAIASSPRSIRRPRCGRGRAEARHNNSPARLPRYRPIPATPQAPPASSRIRQTESREETWSGPS